MASISPRHVRKSFGPTLVIPDLSLEIRDRELIAFVGSSGCGKSTLLRCIAGIERLDGGEVWIAHLTVYENMSLGLQVHETPSTAMRHVHLFDAAGELSK